MKKIIEKVGDNKFAQGLAVIIGIGSVVILPLAWWFWERVLTMTILGWILVFVVIVVMAVLILLLYFVKKTSPEEMPPVPISEPKKIISPKPTKYFPFPDQGCITNPDNFFGRELLLQNIFANLARGSNLSLIGESKVGKSSLLHYVCQVGYRELGLPKENFIYLDMLTISDEKDFFTALCIEIGVENTSGYELARKLKNKRFILCLDEIEKMTSDKFSGEERIQLSGLAGGSERPLTLLIASRSSLEELFPDSPLMTSPLANVCENIDIHPFSSTETKDFIVARLQRTKVQFTEEEIATIWEQTQGYPAEVQRLAKKLYQEKINI